MLKTYFEISLGVSAAILMIFALTPLFNRRYTAKLRYILWIITAVALIIPLKFSFAPRINVDVPIQSEFANQHISVAAMQLSDNSHETAASRTDSVPQGIIENRVDIKAAVTPKQLLTAIWLLGILVFMLYYIIGYIMFCRKIRPWCSELEGYGKKPRIMRCKIIKSPMLTGFLKPRILVPPNSECDMNLVLSHEMTHYKRGDLWVKLLFIIANAIHWFNPIIYIMRRTANKDMEYSCDEAVIKNRDIEFKKAYSKAILHSASGGSGTALSTYFKEDKKNLKKRFSNILSGRKKQGVIAGCIICAAVILCAGVFSVSDSMDSGADKGEIIGNYLFMGLDGRGNIDTMMALLVNSNEISVVSIPRNTVPIKQWSFEEPNKDMMSEITNSVSMLTGSPVQRYFAVDIEKAEELLSVLGNVKFTIPDLYGNGTGMAYDDPYQNLHISLAPGEHELSAREMLNVMRYRKGNVNDTGRYMTYENGNLGRIEMTHSLLGEIIKQKADILSDRHNLTKVIGMANSAYTNMSREDMRKIWETLNKKKVSINFSILPGEYAEDVDLSKIYVPYVYVNNPNLFSEYFTGTFDTIELKCEVESVAVHGEELLDDNNSCVVLYNEREEQLHTCIIANIKDNNSIIIQPYDKIIKDENGYYGQFTFKTLDKRHSFEASEGETISKEVIYASVTGVDTDEIQIQSDDGKYAVRLKVV